MRATTTRGDFPFNTLVDIAGAVRRADALSGLPVKVVAVDDQSVPLHENGLRIAKGGLVVDLDLAGIGVGDGKI